MKKLFILLIYIPLVSFGQDLNKSSDGYVEVVEVELTKQEIHQKISEWIALNYKSAKDVIQLNTEDKIVVKGNYTFTSAFSSPTTYGVRNTLTFSLRDNKYKIDLIPNSMFNKSNMKDEPLGNMTQYFKDLMSFENFKPFVRRNTIINMQNLGYSEKRAIKMVDNQQTPEIVENLYNQKKNTFNNWNSTIKNTFQSIIDYINKSNDEDDW